MEDFPGSQNRGVDPAHNINIHHGGVQKQDVIIKKATRI